MEKEENQKSAFMDNNTDNVKKTENFGENLETQDKNKQEKNQPNKEEIKKPTPEEKIAELEDKITRTFAEMENQRRRFEKEKEDAFEYGGYSFAKEALNLIDNLDRSKLSIKFNASLAKLYPPYSKASSFSFSNLLL